MGDDERKGPGAAGNPTIQIDALTDVQLIDHAADAGGAGDDVPAVSVPPPLPRRTSPAPRSNARALGLTLLAVIAGLAFAFFVMEVLLPATPPVPASAASPPTSSPPPPSSVVRRVDLDEELVIHAGSGPEE